MFLISLIEINQNPARRSHITLFRNIPLSRQKSRFKPSLSCLLPYTICLLKKLISRESESSYDKRLQEKEYTYFYSL